MGVNDRLPDFGSGGDAGLVGRMIDGILLGAQPLLVAFFLWRALDADPAPAALWCIIALAGTAILRRLLLWPASRRLYALAYGGGVRMRRAILAHLVGMPLGAFRAIGGGKVMQAVSEDILWLENHASHTRPEIVANAAVLAVCLVGAVVVWPVTGLSAIFGMAIGLALLSFARRRLAVGLERRARSLAEVSLVLQEQAEGVAVLRAFADGADADGVFARAVERLRDGAWRGVRKITPIAVLFRMVIDLSAALAIFLAVFTFGDASHADAARLAISALLVVCATVPARNFASLSAMLELARIGRANVRELLAVPLTPTGRDGSPEAFDVHYENVSFTHRGRTAPALEDITFKAAQGEMTVLIGANGSGKTTCMQLLMRFWEPDRGRILIGGRDIRDIDSRALSTIIAPVFQEALLFDDTIGDNIRVGRPSASDEEVEAAARAAAIHDVILGFERGYQTRVGALGARLSGGERQRMCIARAILKDAPIVILDEATSALDPENEEAIQRAIAALAAGRSLFVIAHDLASIVAADRIVLLDGGRIEASGSHEALLVSSPTYRRLWRRSAEMRRWKMAQS
ncbi:ABC transporter ATP-binding protein/permease [Shinella curvata]|uniref:ABC transporter ATP-binding protein/permease n=1 Tax=Shinella curvata TaxID=1817964 RepID=A0ABT8XDB7_9HYPH|nr:ABC transporter ATP-binding protein [Shinella curvata]MCJ8055322.1 ABC transporter ATP-binding protein/permease [Shinella curvata]MDO6121739.1 ABC transporter ATP-binding protein/permease [Shinella curvata]